MKPITTTTADRAINDIIINSPLAAAGLLGGPIGTVNRALTIALSVAALAAAGAVGHSGGELVYRHGAAAAYVQPDPSEIGSPLAYSEHDDGHADDDD